MRNVIYMSKCIKCGCELIFDGINKNTSIEHIIPNAIGGKLKSSKLLCKNAILIMEENVIMNYVNN